MKKSEWIGRATLFAVLVLIDQGIKAWIRTHALYTRIAQIGGIADIVHVTNTGAAFGLMEGRTALLAVLSAVILALFFVMLRWIHPTRGVKTAVCAVAAGAMGNLIDRVVFGQVTDYIRLRFVRFPVFNFADICVTLAGIYVILWILLTKEEKSDAGEP